jgi:hypothetical protein
MPIRRLPEGAQYDPDRVLDAIIERTGLKDDATGETIRLLDTGR